MGLPAVVVTRFRLLLDCRTQLPIFFAHPSPTSAMPNRYCVVVSTKHLAKYP